MCNDAGWCGSGGPWITPESSMQKIVWTETNVQGPRRFHQALGQPKKEAGYYRDIRVVAFPAPSGNAKIDDIPGKAAFERRDIPPAPAEYAEPPAAETIQIGRIVDLTARFQDGQLDWDVPEGKWIIVRFGHTSTGVVNHPRPSGPGPGIRQAQQGSHPCMFQGLMGKLIADVGPLAGKTLVSTHIDSWETGSQNWTPRFREEFHPPRIRPPALFAGLHRPSGSQPRGFRAVPLGRAPDRLRPAGGKLRRLHARPGARTRLAALHRSLRRLPLRRRGLCRPRRRADGRILVLGRRHLLRLHGNVLGRPCLRQTHPGAEAFTATDGEKWLHHPASIKALGDWALCAGINRFVFHRYAMQPWLDRKPGMSMGPWGLHYERTQTWWEQSQPWHEYLARCQFMLRKGCSSPTSAICSRRARRDGSSRRWLPTSARRPIDPATTSTAARPRWCLNGCRSGTAASCCRTA